MSTAKPDLTRVWASGAPGGNVVDPDVTSPGKFAAGWLAEVPPFEHFNYLQKQSTQGLAHINEQGIPQWDVNTLYPVNAIVKGSNGQLYRALSEQDGNDPTVSAEWVRFAPNVTLSNLDSIRDVNLAGYTSVLTLGYYTAGDGGAAKYWIDNSDAVTADNGFTCIVSLDGKRVKLLHEGVIYPRWAGAKIDDSTDDRTANQLCVDYCSANKYTLKPTSGKSVMTKGVTGLNDEAVALAYPCIVMASNLHIDADIGATWKIKDGQSTNGAPFNVPILFSISQLTNISIKNITLDSNGANNQINLIAHTMMQIGFSGSPSASTMAKCDDMLIDNVTFKNNPGVTCIGLGQSENTSGSFGSRWKILNSSFINNGDYSGDHSSIYGASDDVLVEGCTFINDNMFGNFLALGVDTGGQVAYEMHGSNQRFTNNYVKNYAQGMWMSSNRANNCSDMIVAHNSFYVRDTGVAWYRETAGEMEIRKVLIDANTFTITDDSSAVGLKGAIVVNSTYAVSDILITRNVAQKIGSNTESSAFLLVGVQSVAGQKHDKIKADGNVISGMCFGGYATTNATNGLGRITFTNNEVYDLVATAAFTETAGFAFNIVGSNTMDSLTLHGNSFLDIGGDFDRGVYLFAGTITDLHMGFNSYKGMSLGNFSQGSCTITNKHGYYPTTEYTPVWKAGATEINRGAGSQNAYYTKQADLCTITAKLVLGAGFSFPSSGTISVSLPLPAATAGVKYLGLCLVIDGGVTRYQGQAVIDGTGTVAAFERDGGTFFTDTSPIALANTDELYVTVTYRVVD